MTQNQEDAYFRVIYLVMAATLLCVAAIAFVGQAWPRDLGQWEDHDPAIRQWFAQLMQPDTIGMGGGVSCCGESDGYWADEIHVRDGKVFAVITDDRPDDKLMRMHEEVGTEYEVPPQKIVGREQNLGNPTGHTFIFLGAQSWIGDVKSKRPVLCYVMNGGV